MPTIVHFDIASEDVPRAQKFYRDLLDWDFVSPPGMEGVYSLFETKGLDGKPGVPGGLGKRGEPSQRITVYFGVASVDEYMAKVVKAGGKVTSPKMPVPGFGYLVTCTDTEGNAFGLWQEDRGAKPAD